MTKQWHGGKGSAPRKSDNPKQFADNWDAIFGKVKEHNGDIKDGNESQEVSTEKSKTQPKA
jgi:uncharacterized protein YjbJ (UPF0337 family)|tara:strand:+ start:1373 stop:1555 length:183 start_codon:yes stop_codon:yes gene_type:complete